MVMIAIARLLIYMQVASVVRSGDSPLQPHHIFAVNNLLDDAVRAAIHIDKPGLFSFNIVSQRSGGAWCSG